MMDLSAWICPRPKATEAWGGATGLRAGVWAGVALAFAAGSGAAHAAKPPVAAPAASAASAPAVVNSVMDAPLFYQVLMGEMRAVEGDSGAAFSIMLDAARRSKDPAAFRRAIELALRAKAGDSALQAARQWRASLPDDPEATQAVVELLLLTDRPQEVAEPLGALIGARPVAEQPGLIASLPRFFSNARDPKQAAAAMREALQPFSTRPATRPAVLLTWARMAQAAGEGAAAQQLGEQAQAAGATPVQLAWLALELPSATDQHERWITQGLAAADKPGERAALRLAYARSLEQRRQVGPAAAQLEQLVKEADAPRSAWLMLAAYRLQLQQAKAALQALGAYREAMDRSPAAAGANAADGPAPSFSAQAERAQAQADRLARTLTAQAAMEVGQLTEAERALAAIEPQETDLQVLALRARLLALQGNLSAARQLLRSGSMADQAGASERLLAEAQLLRERGQLKAAATLLRDRLSAQPDDDAAALELGLVLERQKQFAEMEAVLRAVIARKPDHALALNALGYSLADRGVRLAEARTLIDRAAELSGGDPFIIDSQGWVAFRQGRLDDALALLERSMTAHPHSEVAAHLGEVLWVKGRHDDAKAVWRDGLNRDGDHDALKETLKRLKVSL